MIEINLFCSHGLNPGLGNAGNPSYPTFTAGPTLNARMANHSRFTPGDWSASNLDHYNSADASRNESERVRSEAVRLIREREDKTVTTQRDADRRIGERLGDEVTYGQYKKFLTLN